MYLLEFYYVQVTGGLSGSCFPNLVFFSLLKNSEKLTNERGSPNKDQGWGLKFPQKQ